MLSELADKIAGVGMKLNASKCKIQGNQFGVLFAQQNEEYWSSFEQVEASRGFKVLGTMWSLQGGTNVEFKNRLRMAWRKFWQLWPVLGKRSGNMSKRFRLLDSAVGGTLLWACQSLTLTVAQTRQVRTAQRRMQRKLVGGQKRPDEEWLVYMNEKLVRQRLQQPRPAAHSGPRSF